MLSCALVLFVIFGLAHCAVAGTVTERQAITALSSAQVESFTPYSFYAAAAYCPPSQTQSWSCGGPCYISVVCMLSTRES